MNDHRRCLDSQDAARMAKSILQALDHVDAQENTLRCIALNAERIARWARRTEVRRASRSGDSGT